jgi:hypothetical protein
MRNVIYTSDAPDIGHCSQAVRGGGFIFASGQFALDPVTQQIIEGDASQQTERRPSERCDSAQGSRIQPGQRCSLRSVPKEYG